eukprot:316358-Chlamydomonas_euryale.AAC.4
MHTRLIGAPSMTRSAWRRGRSTATRRAWQPNRQYGAIGRRLRPGRPAGPLGIGGPTRFQPDAPSPGEDRGPPA